MSKGTLSISGSVVKGRVPGETPHATRSGIRSNDGGTVSKVMKDFRDFLMRGNVLDLAVAVIIGIAFNAVVNSFVNDVLMQIIAAIVGKPNFDDLTFTIGDGIIYYGKFLTALINFLIIAATLFVIIRAFEAMQKRRGRGDEPEVLKTDEVVVLEEIRDLLRTRVSWRYVTRRASSPLRPCPTSNSTSWPS